MVARSPSGTRAITSAVKGFTTGNSPGGRTHWPSMSRDREAFMTAINPLPALPASAAGGRAARCR
jgi:hypothetical protein